jgi:hypothetical protein
VFSPCFGKANRDIFMAPARRKRNVWSFCCSEFVTRIGGK